MANSVYWEVLKDVKRRLQSDLRFAVEDNDSTLPIKDENITIRKSLDVDKGIDTPALIITPGDMRVDVTAGTNVRDDYAFPVLVQIVDKDANDQYDNLSTYLKWREQIFRAFHQQRLDGCDDVYIGLAREVSWVDPQLWSVHQWFVGGVLLVFIARITRGVT